MSAGQFEDALDDVTISLNIIDLKRIDTANEESEDDIQPIQSAEMAIADAIFTTSRQYEEIQDQDDEDDYSDSNDELYCLDVDNVRKNQYANVVKQSHTNAQNSSQKISNFQPADALFKKYTHKINVEKYEGPTALPNHAKNTLIETQRKADSDRLRSKDKQDRATAEQVMDPRTRMILFKLLNRDMICEINGCISTGKEANVYHATAKTGMDYAIKIFKTSILIFKDRDKYVTGEFRFRHGYSKHNPRKMVRTWAEKEMRNLVRMKKCNLPVPEPILLRSHVLVMEFIGKEGWPAPKLKDVELSSSKACELYRDSVEMMWTMYNKCKLVHADLSEFNLLYHEGKIVIIDVSQSVEHEHPHALEFLRKDCTNITDFFRKKDVSVMTVKELFDFITDPTINETNIEDCLEKMSEKIAHRSFDEFTEQQKLEEAVFKQIFIPKTLHDVNEVERDIFEKKNKDDLVYKTITGLDSNLRVADEPEILQSKEPSGKADADRKDNYPDGGSLSEETDSDSSDDEKDDGKSGNMSVPRSKNETAEERKARKKMVKDEKAEKRKSKVKKHVKKRKEKLGSKK
ncbi:serine/threonine-protein kinase RIO1 [Toxorhynchites rutilus septentrionalis]|uniref:serine/threonine-protein kinase RIO1 n=1 Tax=Toxorhynchites rutilus septentrionalis TaxID=329112 RepID=UPI002478D288|nr:serine/threonine-protein kinase RIO1 [Toxorhynchites rutilus septentrionalis]